MNCKVCGGEIIEDKQWQFNSCIPPIFGPGSRDQFDYKLIGYYCQDCGIQYNMTFITNMEQDK